MVLCGAKNLFLRQGVKPCEDRDHYPNVVMGTLEKTQIEICTATAFPSWGFLPSSLVLTQIILVKWNLALLPAFNWHLACQRCFFVLLCAKNNIKKTLSAMTQQNSNSLSSCLNAARFVLYLGGVFLFCFISFLQL